MLDKTTHISRPGRVIYRQKYFYYSDQSWIFRENIKQATEMWRNICRENMKFYGSDAGSLMLGAGIAIYMIPRRKRNFVEHNIIDAVDVTNLRRNKIWERDIDKILNFLKAENIDCHYNSGSIY
jgi:hypothetical protein